LPDDVVADATWLLLRQREGIWGGAAMSRWQPGRFQTIHVMLHAPIAALETPAAWSV